jgi:hypothetical protein
VSEDIVKNIVLKFKSSTQEIQSVERALQRLGKIGTGTTGFGGIIKDLAKINDQIKKTGTELPKSMQSLSKAARELTTVELRNAEKNFDKLSQKAEKSIQRLNKMLQNDAAPSRIAAMQRVAQQRVGGALEVSNSMVARQELIKSLGGAGGGGSGGGDMARIPGSGGGGLGGMTGLSSAAIGTAVAAGINQALGGLGVIRGFNESAQQNRMAAVGPVLEARRNAYAGNMEDAVAQYSNNAVTRAKAFATKQRRLTYGDVALRTAGGVGSMLLGAGLVAGAGAATIMTGGVAAPLTLGVGAAGAGLLAGGGYTAFGGLKEGVGRAVTGQTNAEYAQNYQNQLDREKTASLSVDLYRQFRQTSRQRYELQRTTGQSSQEAFQGRMFAAHNMMDEGDFNSTIMQNRNAFGNQGAVSLARQTAVARQGFGLTTNAAQTAMSVFGMQGAGGAAGAGDALKEVMRTAISLGIKDSGLQETLLKNTEDIMNKSGSKLEAGKVMENLMNFMPSTGAGPREIAAAASARDLSEKYFQGTGGVDVNIVRSAALKTLRNVGGKGAVSTPNIDLLNSLTPEQRQQGTEETRAAFGVNDEKIRQAFSKQVGVSEAKINPYENAAIKSIQAKAARGEKISEAEIRQLGTARTSGRTGQQGFRETTEEARYQESMGFLTQNYNIPKELLPGGGTANQALQGMGPGDKNMAMSQYMAGQKAKAGGAEQLQTQKEFQGQAQKEKDMYMNINENMSKFADIFDKMTMQIEKINKDNAMGDSVDGAVDALDKFTNALTAASRSISSKGNYVGGRQ